MNINDIRSPRVRVRSAGPTELSAAPAITKPGHSDSVQISNVSSNPVAQDLNRFKEMGGQLDCWPHPWKI